ncbi:uncharacterized protein LOC132746132 [Ruditapes philippinarum]|uniref:uncharacterized protein LOC132746132 n=1 Tax=Ruditapes philippinarum TaxID=129788 RepID=UPI00295B3595|nr:uncharacterized protein LOC132746132 [Ruditapes philippinarum]XP_060591194.1 uncharacterized protein LOC132746132 [Ruditapes philippinarum]
MENISCLWSDILDCIGYDKEIISIRRNFWQQKSWPIFNEWNPWDTHIVAGSKAEGITSIFESDIDFMLLCKDTICSDEDLTTVSGFTTLYADTRETPPGYTRLKMISKNCCQGETYRQFLKKCFFESESSDVYISSFKFSSLLKREGVYSGDAEFLNNFLQRAELSGPSLPTTYFGCISSDSVLAIPCHYPKILQTWKKRKRRYTWPPEYVIEAAASMQPQVVPKGSKNSDDKWREWRFCFIKSELELTSSLNETQIKLYILLKIVAKDILKNVSEEISSYMMKNITFWLAELLPEELFRKDKLISLLFLSLMYLKLSISESNSLPYYMIPGRNLLSERLSPESRRQMCELLGMLIAEGPGFIFIRCSKLKSAWEFLFTSPIPLDVDGGRRDMIEKIYYSFLSKLLLSVIKDDDIVIAFVISCIHFYIPELYTLINNGITLTEITLLFQKRVHLWLEKVIPIFS